MKVADIAANILTCSLWSLILNAAIVVKVCDEENLLPSPHFKLGKQLTQHFIEKTKGEN